MGNITCSRARLAPKSARTSTRFFWLFWFTRRFSAAGGTEHKQQGLSWVTHIYHTAHFRTAPVLKPGRFYNHKPTSSLDWNGTGIVQRSNFLFTLLQGSRCVCFVCVCVCFVCVCVCMHQARRSVKPRSSLDWNKAHFVQRHDFVFTFTWRTWQYVYFLRQTRSWRQAQITSVLKWDLLCATVWLTFHPHPQDQILTFLPG